MELIRDNLPAAFDLAEAAKSITALAIYRAVFIHSDDPIVVLNAKGEIVDCSISFANLLKTTRAHLEGKYLFDFVAAYDKQRTQEKFSELARTGKTLTTPFYNDYVAVDDSIVPLVWRTTYDYWILSETEQYTVGYCNRRNKP